ncbi:hypothetical protein L1987_03678 [Smallanthus sonchifolius]|uniref:Uncharacterized protein n=1 Tax=Smallanthus sonchifolius TaxID=185202 RepID=A0ACB9KBC3_9ASTR|nr:hypothetical protein L1987_03678 [Smallanthus sonchifolius]
MGEVRLFVNFNDDDDDEYLLYPSISSSEIIFCRICHEAEFESSKTMESPCSCSGTVKFAHRDCIQRWCDEKGNTTCEICLQEFEPGYSSPLKLVQNQGLVRVEVPEIEGNSVIVAQQERTVDPEYPQSSSSADTSASICRFLCIAVTLLLLVRHLFVLSIEGTRDYPFTLLTLLVMRASGIIVPMYIIMHTVDSIHKTIIASRYQVSEDGSQRQQYRLV